jgi:hypothetical protein
MAYEKKRSPDGGVYLRLPGYLPRATRERNSMVTACFHIIHHACKFILEKNKNYAYTASSLQQMSMRTPFACPADGCMVCMFFVSRGNKTLCDRFHLHIHSSVQHSLLFSDILCSNFIFSSMISIIMGKQYIHDTCSDVCIQAVRATRYPLERLDYERSRPVP